MVFYVIFETMKTLALLLILVSGALATAGDGAEKPMVEQFQKSLFEEEANRDLKKAAEGYEAVIEAFDRNRAIAASAIFRLAEVKRKQGDEEKAAELYLRLVEEFPKEETLVKLSAQNLQILGITVAAAPGGNPTESLTVPTMREEETKALTAARSTFLESPDLLEVVKPNGETLLSDAAGNSHLEVARFLLDKGVDVNQRIDFDLTALHRAAQNGHLAMTKLLVERGAVVDIKSSESRTPLHYAVSRGHVSTVNYLMDAGADITGEVELFYHYETKGEHQHRNYRYTPGSPDSGRDRVSRGEVFFESGTLMHLGAINDTAGILPALIERGLSPDAVTSGNRQTPLHLAMRASNEEAGIALIKAGVDVNAQTADGFTPLMLAVARYAPKAVSALIDAGADPNIQAKDGRTALHFAAEFDDVTTFITQLIRAGADPNLVAADKVTPLLVASGKGSLEVVDLLLDEGARANVARESDGVTPLMALFGAFEKRINETMTGDLLAVGQKMIDKGGADINALDKKGWTGIYHVTGEVATEAARFYLENGVDLSLVDGEGVSAFVALKGAPGMRGSAVLEEIWRRTLYPKLKERDAAIWEAYLQIHEVRPHFPVALSGPDQSVRLEDFLAYGRDHKWPADPALIQVSRGAELIKGPDADFLLQPGDVVERIGDGDEAHAVEPRNITVKTPHGERKLQLLRHSSNDLIYEPASETFIGLTLNLLLQNSGMGGDPTLDTNAVQVTRSNRTFTVDAGEQDLLLLDGDELEFKAAEAERVTRRRKGGIHISRPEDGFITEVFHHEPEIGNRYQLAEAIVDFYSTSNQVLPNPDFRKVTVRRLAEDGSETQLTFDLVETLGSPPVTGIMLELAPGAEEAKAKDFGFQFLKELLSSIEVVDESTIRQPHAGRIAEADFKDLGFVNVVADEVREKLLSSNPPLARFNFKTGPAEFPAPFNLQWGDIIEIPATDGEEDLPWIGFDSSLWFKLKRWSTLYVEAEILSTGYNEKIELEPRQPLFRKMDFAWERDISQYQNWRSIQALLKAVESSDKKIDVSRLLLKRESPQKTVLIDSAEKRRAIDLRVYDKVVLTPRVE